MFEKEAQRSFNELDDRGVGDDWSIEESYVNGYSNGAEFGYNKAKEDANKIIQSLLTIIYTESRTDIYVQEISDAESFLDKE